MPDLPSALFVLSVPLSPISRSIEIGLAIGAVLILILAARAFLAPEAWGDGAEYEMMGMSPPGASPKEKSKERKTRQAAGTLGVEDRVVRIGFVVTLGYLGVTWFGPGSIAMWIAALVSLYLLVTALTSTDPVYRMMGVTTRSDP